MTDEGGSGVDLGTLEVAITGTLTPLETALAKAEEMLAGFDKKFGQSTSKTARQAAKLAKANAAETPAPSAVSGVARGKGSGAPSNVNVNFKTDGVRKDVEGQLAGEFKIKIVTEDLKLNVDQVHLRSQVLEAIKGITIGLGAGDMTPGSAPGHLGTPTNTQQAQAEAMRRSFPPEVVQSLKQIKGLGDAIDDLHSVIDDSLQFSGQAGLPQRGQGETLDKMADIANRFNLSNSKLVEYLNAEGRPTTNVTGGPLGPKSPALAGMDASDISMIGQQARVVSELSKGSAFLTKFFDALPGVGAAAPPPPPPAPRAEMPVGNREEPAPPPRHERQAEQSGAVGQPLTREDFIDYVSRVAGPGKGALPSTRSIAIPAKLAGLGDIPLESLQAAKTSAGRTQGIQGGLGPLTSILQFAERGGFENFAEIQKNGRGTGTLRNYDPQSVEGDRIRRNRIGVLDGEAVRAANPRDLLATALKAMHPGIEARSNPTDPMSSLLERILVGPGAQALAAGKRLSVPPRGTSQRELEEPSHTSSSPAGGPLGSGSSLVGAARDYGEMYGHVRDEVRGQMFDQTPAGSRGHIDEGRADEITQARIAEAARAATAARAQLDEDNRNRVRVSGNAEAYPGDIRDAGTRRREQADQDRADLRKAGISPTEFSQGRGGYAGILQKLAGITGESPEGLPESYRSVMLPPKNGQPVFSGSAVRRLLEEEDNRIYDAMGLEGRKRSQSHLPIALQADRAAVEHAIYGPQEEAEKDVQRRGEGSGGRRPAQELGSHLTGLQTDQGRPATEPDYARPSTTLDIRMQQLQGQRIAAQQEHQAALARADAEAERRMHQRFGGRERKPTRDDPNPTGAEAYTFADEATRKQAAAFYSRSRSALRGGVSGGTGDIDEEIKSIRKTQEAANRLLASFPAGDIGVQREHVRTANVPDDLRQEMRELLESRYAEAVTGPNGERRPNSKEARAPMGADQYVNRVHEAGGRPYDENNPAGGGGGGGVGIGPGGRSFAPGGAPIEVIVVGKFPLPVEVVGGTGEGSRRGGGGGGGGGRPRKNVKESVGGAWHIGWVPDEAPPAEQGPNVDRSAAAMRTATGAGGRAAAAARRRYGPGYVPAASQESRQAMYERLFAQRDKEDEEARKRQYTIQPTNRAQVRLEAQRDKEARQPELEQRRENARRTRLQTRARREDPVGFAEEQDVENDATRELRGQLRRLNRVIPRRSFGASLTDLISSSRLVPGSGSLAKQLEAGDLAAKEAAEIQRVSTQRAQTRVAIRNLGPQIQAARAAGNVQQATDLEKVRDEQIRAYGNQNKVIEESTKRFKGFYEEATKGTTVFKSFTAAAAGGAAAGGLGSLQFALGAVIAQPIMAAMGELTNQVLAPAFERLTGYAGTTARVQSALGDQTRAAGGRSELAFAQTQGTTGLGATAAAQIKEPLTKRAQIDAGNKALQDQLDLFRAAQKIGAQGGPEAALSQNLTGFGGLSIGGQKSAEETINDLFQDVSSSGLSPKAKGTSDSYKAGINDQIATLQAQRNEAAASGVDTGILDDMIAKLQGQLGVVDKSLEEMTKGVDTGGESLKFFNAQAQDAGANLKVVFGNTVKNESDRAKQVKALTDAGLQRFASGVSEGRYAFTNNQGNLITDSNQLKAELDKLVTSAPKPAASALLAANSDQLKAQLETRGAQFRLQRNTVIPQQLGISDYTNPLQKASAGINTGGLSSEAAKSVNMELAKTQKLYDGIAADAKVQRDAAVDFVTNGADIFGTGQKVGGLGTAAGADFAKALDAAAGYAKQINDVQLGVQTKQAAYEAAQFTYQITLSKRALSDAKGLTGQIVGDEKNLGVIQREQFELQRQSQALSLEQSQRQINFQKAVANFQAPGLTSEEREARIQAAKIEADYAQKQLDIQKKLFSLGGKEFKVSAGRSVQDLTNQLSLLERGREVSLSTAAAEKKIAALTKLQERENKKVALYYQTAVDNTNDLISLTGTLVAATGKDMAQLANDVISAYAKVYRGLINTIEDSLPGGGAPGDSGSGNKQTTHASGLLGMTTGATSLGIAGEAGGEAVAILRNPHPFSLGDMGGGGKSIQIVITGNTVRNDQDIDEIARKVERVLNTRGAQLGIRPPGG